MKDIFRYVLVLALFSTIAAASLAKIFELTKEPIAEAKRQETLRAIGAVLPPFNNSPDVDKIEVGEFVYFPAKSEGALVGVAFTVSSTGGFGGLIEAMVGVSPTGETTGVKILAHSETPGLGAKIDDDEEGGYLSKLRGKTLKGFKWAVKKDGGSFDQITGATISPRALVGAVKEGLERFEADKGRIIDSSAGK